MPRYIFSLPFPLIGIFLYVILLFPVKYEATRHVIIYKMVTIDGCWRCQSEFELGEPFGRTIKFCENYDHVKVFTPCCIIHLGSSFFPISTRFQISNSLSYRWQRSFKSTICKSTIELYKFTLFSVLYVEFYLQSVKMVFGFKNFAGLSRASLHHCLLLYSNHLQSEKIRNDCMLVWW